MANETPRDAPETIGKWVYSRGLNGDLFRRRPPSQAGTAGIEFVAPAAVAHFALRMARLAAGLPEFGELAISAAEPEANRRRDGA